MACLILPSIKSSILLLTYLFSFLGVAEIKCLDTFFLQSDVLCVLYGMYQWSPRRHPHESLVVTAAVPLGLTAFCGSRNWNPLHVFSQVSAVAWKFSITLQVHYEVGYTSKGKWKCCKSEIPGTSKGIQRRRGAHYILYTYEFPRTAGSVWHELWPRDVQWPESREGEGMRNSVYRVLLLR
jgi:hypothetical protein